MSLKSLFGRGGGSQKTESKRDFSAYLSDVESVGYIEEYIKDKVRVKSHTDFSVPEEFVQYGSLEEYYDAGIKRIQQLYPYDGTLREKLRFFNDSSGFDLHLFENEYPRTTGYIKLSENRAGGGWGTRTSVSGNYGNPATKEYIFIKGGPNVGNIFHTASSRFSNLEINGQNGNTVEFWLKKPEFVGTSKTKREVVFDFTTTGSVEGEHKYGRFTIELDSSDSAKSPFLVTYQSGTTGFKDVRVGKPALYTSGSDDAWHHYSFTMQNVSSSVRLRSYVDGELHQTIMTGSSVGTLNTAMVGTIGSLVAYKDARELGAGNAASDRPQYPGRGYGKLSGSLDEFRFWKTARNSKEVGRFYNHQIGAGTNKNVENSSLGVYYKFNEGLVGDSGIDNIVLDYSGRVSNGDWVGYASVGRHTGSAITESSASFKEFRDPILYSTHPDVVAFTTSSLEEGYAFDLTNNSSLYYSIPDWIVDEDGQENGHELRKITQIMASYFDSLFIQIKEMKDVKENKYPDLKYKPHPFNNVKLESLGLVTPELFLDKDTINIFNDRNEEDKFREKLHNVKNFIYNNIYNNINSIYKSKGTERSFRNLFRCFGVDSELIKMNLYSTDSVYPLENSYIHSTVKNKYVNFDSESSTDATVFQTASLPGTYRQKDARGYVTGSSALPAGSTTQAQIFFPNRYPIEHDFYRSTPLSSSLFGCHAVRTNTAGQNGTSHAWTAVGDDDANFQVYAVKDTQNSTTAKFVLTCRNGLFDPIETEFIPDLYTSRRWHVAVRTRLENRLNPDAMNVSGSATSYFIELACINAIGNQIDQQHIISSSMSQAVGAAFTQASRRFYVGTHRTDFDGGILQRSDIKATNFRHWLTFLSDDELHQHTIDPKSFGVTNPTRDILPLGNAGGCHTPRSELLTINWNFESLTGSNTNGEMWVTDVSSGSVDSNLVGGSIEDTIKYMHPAKGISFGTIGTGSIDVEFDQAAKLQPLENVRSGDMVNISLNDDVVFTRETKPTDYYFSFEKSMYAVVSDEMLNFFAGINDFNNAIGAPVERFRQDYKGLSKLRQMFFDRVGNSPDIERFMEYYKWLDSSLSVMIDQFVPASVAASEDIRNVIESHILERNKFQSKYPTLELKKVEPLGQIRAINELLYDWNRGHAPLGSPNNKNCLWTSERAQRNTDLFVSGTLETDSDREIIRRASITSVSGSTYATRRLSRPYRLTVEDQRHAKGGDNTFGNKKKRFYTGVTSAHEKTHIAVTASEAASTACKDVINPHKKHKIHAPADIAFTHKDRDINDIAPFTIYSSSIDAPTDYKASLYLNFKKGVDITNLHSDEYGDDREVTLQSPFTERWVGGNAHRHQDLSGSLLGNIENKKDGRSRSEAFKIATGFESATATITVSDHTEINTSDTIQVIATDGTVITATAHGSTTTTTDINNPTFAVGTAAATALAIAACLNGNSRLTAARIASTVVQVTQNVEGASGNTTITITDSGDPGLTKTDFTGGVDGLYVLPPNATGLDDSNLPIIDHSIQHAQVLRGPLAKRPVNIDNIQSTTSSISLGNYNHMYDIVQYTSEDQRKDFLVDNLEQMTSSNSTGIPGVKEFARFARPVRKTVFKARFASPGGTEVAGNSRGGHGLDRETNQYSVYNSLNYRNLSVRGPMNFLSKLPQSASNKDSNSLVTNHKVNANPRHRRSMSGQKYSGETDINKDNLFVQHPIPQNDYQYAWITASLNTAGRPKIEFAGHLHSFTQAALGGNTTGSLRYERTYEFLSASTPFPGAAAFGNPIVNYAGINFHQYPHTLTNQDLDVGSNTSTLTSSLSTITVYKNNFAADKAITGDSGYLGALGPGHQLTASLFNIGLGFTTAVSTATANTYAAEAVDRSGYSKSFVDSFIGATAVSTGPTPFQYGWTSTNGVYQALAFRGTGLPHTDITNPPVSSDYWSWVALFNPITTPGSIDINFDVINQTSRSNNNMYLQYKKSGGSYVTVLELASNNSDLVASVSNNRHDRTEYVQQSVRLSGLGQGPERPLELRWIVRNSDISMDGLWSIRNIEIKAIAPAHFHTMILSKQGPYGYPSWKQLRVGQTQMGRYLRKKNIYAPPMEIGSPSNEGRRVVRTNTLGNYSWPDSTNHRRIYNTDRDVSNSSFRFTDPPVTSNRYPIKLFGMVLDSKGIPKLAVNKFVFSNIVGKFATDNLTNLLRVQTPDDQKINLLDNNMLRGFDLSKPVTDWARFDMDIFPKEENAYLERTRQRTEFKTDDFWKTVRSERTLTNVTNSQGNTIPRMSIWPLDEPDNFRTTALKTTSDHLGADGAGELFANYSVFHNNLHFPSASAVFARPFPMQATSSLPNSFTVQRFILSASYSAGKIYDQGLNTTNVFPENDLFFQAANTTNYNSIGGSGFNTSPGLPPGWKTHTYNGSSYGTASGPTNSVTEAQVGPRVMSDDFGTPSGLSPMAFVGRSVAVSAMYDPPKSSEHTLYRWVRTTSSYDFPGKITFLLRTGASTTAAGGGIVHKSTTPFYVQIGDEDQSRGDRGYRTVATIGSSSGDIDTYASDTAYQFVDVLVTASLTNQKIRFVSVVTGSSAANDISGQWAMKAPNVFEMKTIERDTFADLNVVNNTLEMAISDMTASFITSSVRTYTPTNSKKELFTPFDETGHSVISTTKISNYADLRGRFYTGSFGNSNNTNTPTYGFEEASGTFAYFLHQSGGYHIQNIYKKDERVDHHLFGSQFFKTPEHSGRNPFNFDNYNDFAHQTRLIAKDFSLVPEFRISEHMDHYINTVGGADPYFTCNDSFLTITGAASPSNSSMDNFYKIYSHTDFVKDFEVVEEQMLEIKSATPQRLMLKCKALKKFLPYKGLYPADRMTQLASEFSSSYSQHADGLWRNVLAPYYAPGIAFNTIKSGISVDYPIFEPHEDKIYNQYGVMFQSASVTSYMMTGSSSDFDNFPKANPNLSRNRIEIGGGSEWAKSLTGSIASGNHNDKIGVSFWMYLPMTNARGREQDWRSFSMDSLYPLQQCGTVISLGSGEVEDQAAFKKGFHLGYAIDNDSLTYSGFENKAQAQTGANKKFKTHFVAAGGNGKDFFVMKCTPPDGARFNPGWNHYYVEFDLNTIDVDNFKCFVNGRPYSTAAEITSSAGFTLDGSSAASVVLDGERNCYLGSHLGAVKSLNADSNVDLGFLGNTVDSTLKRGLATTKPSENIMTEVLVFNKQLDKYSVYALGGSNPDNPPAGATQISALSQGDTASSAKFQSKNHGSQIGPRNPYTVLPRSLHDNLVAWYRPGNDTGYMKAKSSLYASSDYLTDASMTNNLPVFNHASPLYSGKTILASSGSFESKIPDTTAAPTLANHLSGTFYGFSTWSGSLDQSPSWSSRSRRRWNGITDITNPAQYTLYYYVLNGGEIEGNGSTTYDAPAFKTWWTNARDNAGVNWKVLGTTTRSRDGYMVESTLRDNHPAGLSGSANTFVSGAYTIPTFVVGSKFNFTDDASIPRIGSPEYHKHFYTGSMDIGSEPTSLSLNIDTGIKSVTRIPFEAIVDPAIYTPPTVSTEDGNQTLFYEMEPHPSASLLGANTVKRRLTGDLSGPTVWSGSFNVTGAVQNTDFVRGVAAHSSSLVTKLDLDAIASTTTMYTRAASNFYAECLNLFIENSKGVTIRSSDVPQEIDSSVSTYEARVILGSGRGTSRDNPMYNNPAAFGPPCDVGRVKTKTPGGINLPRYYDKLGYGFAPYLPPHYDGLAEATLKFTPDSNTQYNSIRQILSETTVEFERFVSATGSMSSKGSGRSTTDSSVTMMIPASVNRDHAMHLSASFSGFGFNEDSFVQSYNSETGDIIENRSSLVLQTRFECPTFNFTGTADGDVDQPRTSKTTQTLPKIKGIWHQTGSITGKTRPSVWVGGPRDRSKGDLSKLIGLGIEREYNKIGSLPSSKLIKEAVIAVPFKTVNGEKKFFKLPKEEVYQSVRNLGFPEYRLDTEDARREQREAANILDDAAARRSGGSLPGDASSDRLGDPPRAITPRRSIFKMVKSMMDYNIPPHFNFLKYNDPTSKFIEPFAMYIFEFSVTLSRQDVANIWQNVTPDVGLDSYYGEGSRIISSQVVDHELFGPTDLMEDGGFDEDVQWMVFKVKQKAQTNYFKKKKLDKLPDGHPEKKLSVENDIFEYGFNWPYDYFSLIELVNIGTSIDFKYKPLDLQSSGFVGFSKE